LFHYRTQSVKKVFRNFNRIE